MSESEPCGHTLIFTPDATKNLDKVVARAVEMAKDVLKVECEVQTGEKDFSTMKYFVFSEGGYCYPLWGQAFGPTQKHPKLDELDQLALVVKIMVNVLQSRVVMHLAEVWTAPPECHKCGKDYSENFDFKDSICECGEKRCQPRDHPKCQEKLMANVLVFEGVENDRPKIRGHAIFHNIERDDDGVITGFPFDNEQEGLGISGRMCDMWTIRPHETPHVLANFPHFCDALSIVCPDQIRETSKLIVESCPEDYTLLRWYMDGNMKEVLDNLKMQGFDPDEKAIDE